MRVWSLGWKDSLEEGVATHSSILAWRIPWAEEPGGPQSKESQWVRHAWSNLARIYTYTYSTRQNNQQGTSPVPGGTWVRDRRSWREGARWGVRRIAPYSLLIRSSKVTVPAVSRQRRRDCFPRNPWDQKALWQLGSFFFFFAAADFI